MTFKLIRYLFTLTFLLTAPLSLTNATETNASSLSIELGKAYFEAGDFNRAISVFESLIIQDKSSDKLYYNLAVAYYKNKQYDNAEIHFKKITHSPAYASVSFLNLGLIETKRDNIEAAKIYFQKAITAKPDGHISRLAHKMLSRIESKDKNKQINNDWLTFLFMNFGTENKTLEPSPEIKIIGRQNQFVDLTIFTTKNILEKHVRDLSINFNTFTNINHTNSDTDFLLLTTAINKKNKYDNNRGNFSSGISANYMRFGGRGFQTTIVGDLKSKHTLFKDHAILLRYRLGYINGIGQEYVMYDGFQHKYRLHARANFLPLKLFALYELEKNDRQDKGPIDYSPTRHRLKAGIQTTIGSKLKPIFETEYKVSQYLGNSKRRDEYIRVKASLVYLASNSMEYSIEGIYTDNSSDNANYSYTQKQAILGLQYIFW